MKIFDSVQWSKPSAGIFHLLLLFLIKKKFPLQVILREITCYSAKLLWRYWIEHSNIKDRHAHNKV